MKGLCSGSRSMNHCVPWSYLDRCRRQKLNRRQYGQESSPVLLQIIPRLRHQPRDDFIPGNTCSSWILALSRLRLQGRRNDSGYD